MLSYRYGVIFARTLQEKLEERFPETGMTCLERNAVNYLDPRWKGAHLRLTNKLQRTKLDMEAKYLAHQDTDALEVDLPNPTLSPTSKLIFNSQRDDLGRLSDLEQEMRRYEACPNPGRNADILAFWKLNQEAFPLLARMARIVLAIPASSAKSERVFSTGGLIVTSKRFALSFSL